MKSSEMHSVKNLCGSERSNRQLFYLAYLPTRVSMSVRMAWVQEMAVSLIQVEKQCRDNFS